MNPLKVGLAIALSTVGVGSGVAFGVANLAPVNEVQQAQAGTTIRLYLDMSLNSGWYSSSATFKVHTWNSANGDKYHSTTKVGNAYYYADVDLATFANGGGYRFSRFDSSGNTEWTRGAWNGYGDGVKTYYRVDSGNYDTQSGSWSTADQKTWTLYGSKTGNWTGGSDDISINLEMRFNNEGLSFYNTNVELPAGAEFKVKNATDNIHYGFDAIETGSGSVIASGDVSGSGSSNITVVNSGSYEVYMKPFAGKFWMQENSEATATAWATSFLNATATICSTGGTSADHSSALNDIWGDQKTSFDNLTLGARNLIIAGTANATIKDAHDRYVHIMERYSDSLDSFEDWDVNGARQMSLLSKDNGSIIAVVSVVAVLSLATLAFFAFKKRKHQ